MAKQFLPSVRSAVVIPARSASTRLPRKLLLRETGKSVLEHTYTAACQARRPLGVWVAAGDAEIAREVHRFGGRGEQTDPDLPSGTDRVAELARRQALRHFDILVNVQGDEPEIDPHVIDRLIERLENQPEAEIATLAAPIPDDASFHDPACVKVVTDISGRALYFSRAPIPFQRDVSDSAARPPLMHLALPPSLLEQCERLEQLRALEAGFTIAVEVVNDATCGIDTQEDYTRFVARQRSA